jgi:DNA-binding GntR family transcriptional regulator
MRNMLSERLKDLEFRTVGMAQAISETIMQAIMSGSLNEGEQLVEAELQKLFSVSKSPIREALREVEKMGFVVIKPRRGAFVKAITQRDIEENFRVRSVLEALAAREAYAMMTEAELSEMSTCLENMRRAVRDNDPERYWECHRRFHDSYLLASHNHALIEILQNLHMRNTWYRFARQLYTGDLQVDFAPHAEIFAHFQHRDISEEALEGVMRRHTVIGLSYLQASAEAGAPAHDEGMAPRQPRLDPPTAEPKPPTRDPA